MIRVLHIDDEAPIRMLSRVNLEAAGMEVIEAADGRTGLRLAKREQPDVILLDVMMPAMDGWQVAEELRKDPKTWKIPVVFVTARVALRDRVRGFYLGAVDYIAEPFNPTELAPRLRGLLERLERGERYELWREKIFLNVLAPPAVRRDVRGLRRFDRCTRARSRSTTAPRTSASPIGHVRRFGCSTDGREPPFPRGAVALRARMEVEKAPDSSA